MSDALRLIVDPATAIVALAPPRAAILRALREPGSASSVARALGLPRQRVAYHVRELERHGLVEHIGEKRRGNCTERVIRAIAQQYLISPQTLAEVAPDPAELRDRHSSAYLLATAARLASDIGRLQSAAATQQKKLPTLTMETEVRFASPEDQQGFAEALAAAVAELIERFHSPAGSAGRSFRFVIAGHPSIGPAGEAGSNEEPS